MKKNFKHIIKLFIGCILIISCDDYLDVKPENEFLEEQVYTSPIGVESVMNGIYLGLLDSNLYGGSLTLTTVDVLAQRYNTDVFNHSWQGVSNYSYLDGGVKNTFNGIWSKSYNQILEVNSFLSGVEKYPGTLTPPREKFLKGEAYALRAMLHLDILRLFGPIYSINSNGAAIPYYTAPDAQIQPILLATEVMDKILADLQTAEGLLEDDPIITAGYSDANFRNLRMNYYAVKALQARAYLYAGNKPEALAAAKLVIDMGSQWFPWTDVSAIIAGASSDRIFSPEIIFGLSDLNRNQKHLNYFEDGLGDQVILITKQDVLTDIFDPVADYRYGQSWINENSINSTRNERTLFKFVELEDSGLLHQFTMPLIRISEMYYIAAETETDPTIALGYLNMVRNNRNLPTLTTLPSNLQDEITKEYIKEFYGEGQLFFYYKRKNLNSILASDTSGNPIIITMGADQYVVPLPDSETNFN